MDESLKVTMRTDEASQAMRDAVLKAMTETFEIDIKARAKENAPPPPQTPRQEQLPEDEQYKYTGTNMRSIDTEVTIVDEGVQAIIFTQSGYGGYLELGTAKMGARPYIQPAVQEYVGMIPERVKENLQ
jgi:HK97 gp10 family phage protein